MVNTIKCPQCGAVHVEKISSNYFSCPFCGRSFYTEATTHFVKQETNELKIKQRIETEELQRTLVRKKRNYLFYALLFLCLAFFAGSIFMVSVKLERIFGNKDVQFNNIHELCAFLEAGPFVCESETISFSDFATKATINGKDYTSKPYLYSSGIGGVDIGYDRYNAQTNYTGSKMIISKNHVEDSKKEYIRDASIPAKKYFEFSGESSVRKYLSNAVFSDGENTIRFEDDGNTFIVNDIRTILNTRINCECGERALNIDQDTKEIEFIKSRAEISIENRTDKRYLITFKLIMDQDGNNACLLSVPGSRVVPDFSKYNRIK